MATSKKEYSIRLPMKRVQLFEFHDLDWFPQSWRNFLTDVMALFDSTFNPYKPVIPKIAAVLERLECLNIIDLCSGGSRAALDLLEHLASSGNFSVTITLTDKFPNLPAFREAASTANGKIEFLEMPIDAAEVPEALKGFRTIFSSFHHFPPESAGKILADAVRKNEGIGVFEYTERTWVWGVSLLVAPLFLWLAVPFLKPFKWQRLLWLLFPLPAFFAVWDGLVSCLRTYSPEELEQLVSELNCDSYNWEIGRSRSFGRCYIIYLLGYPLKKAVGGE